MSRTKFTLRAPAGVEESAIEGTYYWPDIDDGTVETTNEVHKEVLIKHGYTLLGEVAIMRAVNPNLGLIDVEEMGRSQLLEALSARGLSLDPDSSRAILVEQAQGWNNARRGRSRFQDKPPVEQQFKIDPNKPTPTDEVLDETPAAPAARKRPDFSELSGDDLRGYLSSRGVAFAKTASRTVLVEKANEWYDANTADKAASAA